MKREADWFDPLLVGPPVVQRWQPTEAAGANAPERNRGAALVRQRLAEIDLGPGVTLDDTEHVVIKTRRPLERESPAIGHRAALGDLIEQRSATPPRSRVAFLAEQRGHASPVSARMS